MKAPNFDTLAAVIGEAPVGVSLHDAECRCVLVNNALVEMTGVSAAQTLGRRPGEYLPGTWKQLTPCFERARHEPVLGVEIEGQTPARGGAHRWCRVDFWPVPHDESVVAMVTDRRCGKQQRSPDGCWTTSSGSSACCDRTAC